MSTKYKATETLAQFLECLRERKKDKGDDVASNLCKNELMRINPECVTLNMWVMDTSWKFVPTPEEGEPKDPVESENKITELKDTYYRMWTRKLKEGKYDPDVSVSEETEEPTPEPENAEVEVKDTHDTPAEQEAEDIATAVEEKVEATKSDTTKDQELSLNLGRVIRDIARSVGAADHTTVPKQNARVDMLVKHHLTDLQSLIDGQEKRIKELEARADKSKDVIISLVQQVKALQQPKAEGVEGL